MSEWELQKADAIEMLMKCSGKQPVPCKKVPRPYGAELDRLLKEIKKFTKEHEDCDGAMSEADEERFWVMADHIEFIKKLANREWDAAYK